MVHVAKTGASASPLAAVINVLKSLCDRRVLGSLLGLLFGKLCWAQYRVLLKPNRPKYYFELPIIGGNLSIFWHGFHGWATTKALAGHEAVLTNVLGQNTVVVSWKLYKEYVKKADDGGELDQGTMPDHLVKLIGVNSMAFMKAGKGQHHHHRLRSKVLASMTPKRLLALVPDIVSIIREELDKMAESTRANGFAVFADFRGSIATRVSGLPITGALEPNQRQELETLFKIWGKGLMVPFGKTFASAVKARERLVEIVNELLRKPPNNSEASSVVSDLAQTSADHAAFTENEIVDTIFTLLFAGKFTTIEALPCILVELAVRDDWRVRIAAEPLQFAAMEADSASLRFVKEVLRVHPPETVFWRQNKDAVVDLGEHGTVPVGCNIAVNFGQHQWALGGFDPDRWAGPAMDRENFLSFGGHAPHSCVGRSLAMLEMQIFARILAREYDVEVMNSTIVRNWKAGGFLFHHMDGLKVKVSRRDARS
jgi:cytochrome P450